MFILIQVAGGAGSGAYERINLRNTRVNGVALGLQPYLHQLSLIANGQMVRVPNPLASIFSPILGSTSYHRKGQQHLRSE